MVGIVTVEQMQAIERTANEAGLAYEAMMEAAGRQVAQAILDRLPVIEGRRIVVLVGAGNNGGDGLVAGHYLAEAGALVSIYLAADRPADDKNLVRLQERGLLIAEAEQDQRYRVLKNSVGASDVIVDALLGTGIKLPLRGTAAEILSHVGQELRSRPRPMIVAVDCPSGIDCDTGEAADEVLAADLTVTMAAAKRGLLEFPAAEYVGELLVVDIGLDDQPPGAGEPGVDLATAVEVAGYLPARPRDSHKGTFGRVVVVGGSITMPGAAALAGLGAYRAGAGLVTLAVPTPVQALLASLIPEATWILLPHEMGLLNESAVEILLKESAGSQTILLGPGLGQDKPTQNFIGRLLGVEVAAHRGKLGFVERGPAGEAAPIKLPPLVIDADALKMLAAVPDWHKRLPPGSILTPHPGEMQALTELDKDEIQADRVEVARKYAAVWGHVVVLKGAFTVVASPAGRASVLPFANSALATAGTGDVLAGIIAGLHAQGVAAFEAAVLGGFIHGRAGELAAQSLTAEAPVIAGDLVEFLPEAIGSLPTAG